MFQLRNFFVPKLWDAIMNIALRFTSEVKDSGQNISLLSTTYYSFKKDVKDSVSRR